MEREKKGHSGEKIGGCRHLRTGQDERCRRAKRRIQSGAPRGGGSRELPGIEQNSMGR